MNREEQVCRMLRWGLFLQYIWPLLLMVELVLAYIFGGVENPDIIVGAFIVLANIINNYLVDGWKDELCNIQTREAEKKTRRELMA